MVAMAVGVSPKPCVHRLLCLQPAPYFANPSRYGVITADYASLKIPRLDGFKISNAILHVAYQPSVSVKQIKFSQPNTRICERSYF
jgi:hypothetical protein